MMGKDIKTTSPGTSASRGDKPCLDIARIGIVSRDYNLVYENGRRDFSHAFPAVLDHLDENHCDLALFSLYSLVPQGSFNPYPSLVALRNLKAVLVEEFEDGKKKKTLSNVIYYRKGKKWHEYRFRQKFARLADTSDDELNDFVKKEMPNRIFGNFCVLLCGEINGVRYSKKDKKVHDVFGMKKSIPQEAVVILNPIHDRMTRFEMKMKRQFLSRGGRWVISVWNKGKSFSGGKRRDGKKPAWQVFCDGREVEIAPIQNRLGVEIGIVEVI